MSSEKVVPLKEFFQARSVAIIGATEKAGAVGRNIVENLIESFKGPIYPVNPKRDTVLGLKAYKSILDCPPPVDLVVVVTPAKTVPGLIKQCVDAKVPAAIVISAGFKEIGPEGVELERRVMEEARKVDPPMRIVGPNCLGVMSPWGDLNATFAASMAKKGRVGFVSQSGALCTSMLDWAEKIGLGFSAFVSIGSMLDVDYGDLIEYLGTDEHTDAIVLYCESIGNARRFLSACKNVAKKKPVIVIKAGRTSAAAKAAASHTGALTGSDNVLNAAFDAAGAMRVIDIEDVFCLAELVAKQPLPKGPKLTIVTNAGGPGVLSTDALIHGGGELTELSEESLKKFDEFLPSAWSHSNPVDILGDALPVAYAKSLVVASQDPNADGMLVVLTPQSMTDPSKTAEELIKFENLGKPIIASFMGGAAVADGTKMLNESKIPCFPFPDVACKVFNHLHKYRKHLVDLYAIPEDVPALPVDAKKKAAEIVKKVQAEKREILTEFESKDLLALYDIPVVQTVVCDTVEVAVAAAEKIGFPVVVKLNSKTITHKSDVGGVQLNLKDGDAVCDAFNLIKANVEKIAKTEDFEGVSVQPMVNLNKGYEIILGANIDQQFGPVIVFGTGGTLVEIYKDSNIALPPLTRVSAHDLMEGTKIFKALQGVRGELPCDIARLESILVNFGQMMLDHPMIHEIDINPMLASSERIIALDARVLLWPHDKECASIPISALPAIPDAYNFETKLDGKDVTVRAVKPSDQLRLADMVARARKLNKSKEFDDKYGLPEGSLTDAVTDLAFCNYYKGCNLIAETAEQMICIVRLMYERNTSIATIDAFNADCVPSVKSEMISKALEIAKEAGMKKVVACDSCDCMSKIYEKIGFTKDGCSFVYKLQ